MRTSVTLGIILHLLPLSLDATEASKRKFIFKRFYIDQEYGGNGKPGFVRPGDMDNDGKMDIISEGCGYKIISYYENQSTDPEMVSDLAN